MKLPLDYSSEISLALKNNIPIVALESTIITHGMPYPKNVECAKIVEQEIRNKNVCPATIAVLHGRIKIGLNSDDFDKLGKFDKAKKRLKISRRDLAYAVAFGKSGGTTVSGTMKCAHLANIKVFATGGIGGVHRGAEKSFDISADLQELAKTNVNVVCARVKSILDLNLTLEYLETMGVPVLGFKTNKLPAFYSNQSPFEVDYRVESAKEIAEMINAQNILGLESGVLITNPIPEKFSLDFDEIEEIIQKSLGELKSAGMIGKKITPFLLSMIAKLSNNKSLDANIELVRNNAKLAADIALELDR